jgi:hypothetical protein
VIAALDQPCWRVIATRIPPVDLFEGVAPQEDFELLFELEAEFSPHYNEVMALLCLPREEWVFGPGAGFIMAPFIYRGPSRFTDGSYGVFYAGLEEETAIREIGFHRGAFMAATRERAMALEEQVLRARVRSGDLEDIRGQGGARPDLYDPDPGRYGPAQAWAAEVRRAGRDGVLYDSVRHASGTCVALFRPKAVVHCRQSRTFRYFWDGSRIVGWG